MLFDSEEKSVINRSLIRKTAEVPKTFLDRRLCSALRTILACSIGRNIVRLRPLNNLANNDFSNIKKDYEVLSSEEYFIPDDLQVDYLIMLSEEGMYDEGTLHVMDTLVSDFLPLLQRAIEMSDLMIKGYLPVIDSDTNLYVCLKNLFSRYRERCCIQGFEHIQPYSDALEYADYIINQCSIMIRIGAYKPIDTNELASIVDKSYEIDCEPFESICLSEMSEFEKEQYLDFKFLEEDRLVVITAKAICNSYFEIKKY